MTVNLEDAKYLDIDEWLTLNTSASPTKLKKGQTPNAQNVWVDEKPGSVITANGYVKVGTNPSGNPTTFCIDFFKASDGSQTFVLSDNSTVWTTVDFQTFTSIITGLSSSFQLRGKVIRDKLWLINGSDSVRTYDGTTVTALDGTAGTPNVPKGRYIEYHDERVWLFHISGDRSNTRFTVLTDNTGAIIAPDSANAWPSSNALQISEGDADFGTGLLVYRGYLYAFKQYAIWRVVGYDEYSYSKVKVRASTGTRFSESIQIVDGLIHFIGVDGIYVFDGEDADRISDIIDPTTASATSFGFNQLQQPNQNNQFWQTTLSADFSLGTVLRNSVIADSVAMAAADDAAADFAAGATLTNMDTASDPGNLKLSVTSSGASTDNVALDGTVTTPTIGSGTSIVGVAAYMTDGGLANAVGIQRGSGGGVAFRIAIPSGRNITRIIIKGLVTPTVAGNIFFTSDAATLTPSAVSAGSITGSRFDFSLPTPTDVTITFPAFTSTYVQLFIDTSTGAQVTCTEVQIYTAAYNATGQFISRAFDYSTAPNSFGNLNVSEQLNSGTVAYYTQSSADGVTWDAAVLVVNGNAIGSTVRRYLRWRADFTAVSGGAQSPVISSAYFGTVYVSPVHSTGGSIFAWGAFQADYSQAGQTVKFYYRGATTSLGVTAAAWNLIVPGGVLNISTTLTFIQFKIELLGGTSVSVPSVDSVTINWVVGTGTQPQTLQNVASAAWRNRYWLAAAGPGASSNDTIVIRGKKPFGSPWQLKDWRMLSFARFQDSLYAGSSVDGSIYRLDTGYSKDGSTIDAFFETGDFTFGGFFVDILEVLVEAERMGTYSMQVGISTDRGANYTEKNVDLTISGADSYTKQLNFAMTTDRFRVRVRLNGVDSPFQVHNVRIFYRLRLQRGSIN